MPGPPIGVGDRIADKYIVESIIGEGGMGLVVAARHIDLDQRVAIKLLLPSIAEQGTAAERFRREARSAARIRSDHVCRVLDVGSLPSGVPYLVMEYLEGCDLATELEKRSHLPLAEAIEYVLQACEGLAEAHSVGIVHRDLKPANLFLAKRSDGSKRIKLLDFGVSKALDDSGAGQHNLTQTSTLVGSPLYMSPEQLSSSRDVDVRTDIWALGAVLYELLTGRPPFSGGNIPQLVHAVMNEQQPSIEALHTTMPRGIDAVIARALQKRREARYASVAELAADLAPFAPRHALVSVSRVSRLLSSGDRRSPVGTEDTAFDTRSSHASNGQSTPMAWSGSKPPVVKKRWLGIVAAVLLLLGIGVAISFGLRSGAPRADVPDGERALHVARPAPPPPEPAAAAAAPSPPVNVPEPEPVPVNDPTEPAPAEPAPAEPAPAIAAPAEPAPPALHEPHRDSSRPRRDHPARGVATDPGSPPEALVKPPPTAPAPEKPKGISDFGGRR